MSREIKFRGKRVNGEMVYGHYIKVTPYKDHDGHRICTQDSWEMFEVVPESVDQFTGRLDKNGKEIYEKSKVSAKWVELDGSIESVTGVVEYSEGWCAFVIHDYENKVVCELNGRGALECEFEVIEDEP